MPPASAEEQQRSEALRPRIVEALQRLGGDTAENRRSLVDDVVSTIEHALTGPSPYARPGITQFGASANGKPSGAAPSELALSSLGRFLDDDKPFLTKNLERWEEALTFRDNAEREHRPAPEGSFLDLPEAVETDTPASGDAPPEETPEETSPPPRKRATRKKPGRKPARKPRAKAGRRRKAAAEQPAQPEVVVASAEPKAIERIDAQAQYLDDLMARASGQRSPDPVLLDRIERLLGLGSA